MSSGTDHSDRYRGENLAVTSRCIAIVLSKYYRDLHCDHDQSFFSENNGKQLLADFKLRNKTCYWNPGLKETIDSLEYVGFVKPSTLLVVGSNLENIRLAWGNRVLNPPEGFTIESIGDVNGIEMQVVPQTKSVPLTDALCHIIMELNNHRIVATLDTIREKLQCAYQDIQLPSDKQLFDTLGTLIRDRKVFHTETPFHGSGYFVVTPETFRLPPTADPSSTLNNWLQYQPMYIPVFPQQPVPMVTHQPPPLPPVTMTTQVRTVSCQAEEKTEVKARSRSQSVRGGKGKDKGREGEGDEFKRVLSVRCRPDKAKKITDDMNSKGGNPEKVKGEKTSLFSKIFGRSKKKSTPPPPVQTEGREGEEEKEYATFSAQFPPPEWQWYQQQQEKHRRTEQWVSQQMVKSRTWHYMGGAAQPEPPQHGRCNTMDGLSRLNHEGASHNIYNTIGHSGRTGHGDYMVIDGLVDPITGVMVDPNYQTRTESGGSNGQEKVTHHRKGHMEPRRSRENLERKSRDHPDRKSQEYLDRNNQDYGTERRRHRKHRSSRNRKERHQDQDENVDPYGVHGNKDPPSPVLASDNFYQPLGCPGPYHSTPRYYDTIPSRQPREDNSTIHPAEQRRSHRHRKKGSHHHHRNTYYGNETDISVEYQGRLPNKNSTYAQSCDSGVNCVGLKPQHSSSTRSLHKPREPMPLPRQPLDKLEEEQTERGKSDGDYVVMQGQPRRLPCNDGYDSSIMETPANTMIVCEAEINHLPIPQIVLDTESRPLASSEPDVAQSSSSNNEVNGSVDTVIEKDELTEDRRGNPAGEDNPEEKPESQQQDAMLAAAAASGLDDRDTKGKITDGEARTSKVEAISGEVRELSLKDSGFSSPRYVEIGGGACPNQPPTYQRFQEHMAKPVLKVNNSANNNNCALTDKVYENQTGCVLRDPLQPAGRHGVSPHDKCQCERAVPNQRNIFRLKPESLVESQWVDGPAAMELNPQQVAYAKQFRLSGEFEVVGVV